MPAKSKNNLPLPGKIGGRSGVVFLCILVVLVVITAVFCWSWQKTWIVATCNTVNLKLVPGEQSGAAGTIYQHMALTNISKHACKIASYPTAFLYGSDGYALGSSAASQPQPTPVTITLAPDETAHTVLGYPQAGNFPPNICSANKSVSLKLYPPGNSTPLETPLEVAWCPGFSQTAVQIGS